jgi:hypothetical protein
MNPVLRRVSEDESGVVERNSGVEVGEASERFCDQSFGRVEDVLWRHGVSRLGAKWAARSGIATDWASQSMFAG